MKTGDVLLGFAIGAVAGLVTGILVAPDKGTETRKMIKNKVKDVTQNFMDEVEDRIDRVEEKVRSMKNKAQQTAEEVKADLKEKAARTI
ncbi:MAG: YtxH domain-containing protein [Lentimicrobiaceae bacterium]|nr:YtxH domain-containing protein [Lentimicrobiaceae bacterium]